MTLRVVFGSILREIRNEQNRTLQHVSMAANLSLGYLSEIERGHKEASSELLESLCAALEIPLWVLLHRASMTMRTQRADVSESILGVDGANSIDTTGDQVSVVNYSTPSQHADGDATLCAA